ncbi:hypothetical protein NCS57_01489400 [Fusarium keratoplasticum]|uniref:Uncharacterized protein n=1 Tax=Fusarium keratoplasticum TaxID=1328300 RepID=A0ACC0QA95_9HYPO|nr:hypothetical protein NCS57_01489400 [Fusarium keratoplasticum]KAI8648215.1 hypothetical protein NCS57_01489400 [Fusarium keratoplasticum]
MGYVWTEDEVKAYDLFYEHVTSMNHAIGVTFTTTHEFARDVLPPCFDVPNPPTGTVYICTNVEEIDGERTGEDEEAGVLSLDVIHNGTPGSYTLSVFVNRDQSLATGREVWSMPKKLGEIHLMGNHHKVCGTAQRKGARMQVDAVLGDPEFTTSPEPKLSTFFEIKALMRASGGFQTDPVLVEFEVTQRTYSSQEAMQGQTSLILLGTEDDPLHTVPVKEVNSGWTSGYGMNTRLVREIPLDPSVDYRPYVYGRFFDNWPGASARAKAEKLAIAKTC